MYAKILKLVIALALVGIGIVGLFVPIVPGILLIVAGLVMLEIKIDTMKNWVKKLKF